MQEGIGQQADSAQLMHKRRLYLQTAVGVGYPATMYGLYQLWYVGKSKDSFHFFDDSGEWQQMDKIGHASTSYRFGRVGYHVMKECGYSERQSLWFGGLSGFAFLGSVEIFDGFSGGYGFSWSDIAANAVGSGLFVSQQYLLHEQPVALKFSFHQTRYYRYHPDLLGSRLRENILKDYNGQTYWLSANLRSFFPGKRYLPGWLNIAAGYGATGMTGASDNPLMVDGKPVPKSERSAHFYLSPDIDLSRIAVRSKTLKQVFRIISVIKFPLPTIEYHSKGYLVFRGMYF